MKSFLESPEYNTSLSSDSFETRPDSYQPKSPYADNRSTVVAQRKMQELANNSVQLKNGAEFQSMAANYSSHQQPPVQKKENKTGLPDNLKAGVETLSGMAMDDVMVHYNSHKPAGLHALAYAQGTNIHVSPGQEEHLPHEAWHVVQQKQGRVKPTMQIKEGTRVNDDKGLENEADVMGRKALQSGKELPAKSVTPIKSNNNIVQAKRYTVSRHIPLETHYSLIEVNNAPKKGEKSAKEKALDTLLSKLRDEHPLSVEDENKAKQEKWSGVERDKHRGKEFETKKNELLGALNDREDFLNRVAEDEEPFKLPPGKNTSTGFWVSGAHVKGLSVVNERERKKTPESGLIKKVTKIEDWIGAHLIKREWGGEDNMWNVVCWPKSAEDKWGKSFEEPIDIAFTNRTQKKLDIEVDVEKEDEVFTDDKVDEIVKDKTKSKVVSGEWKIFIEQSARLSQLEANRALESVPVAATGSSALGTANLDSTDTNWDRAKTEALKKITTTIDTSSKKEPHKKQLENLKESAVGDKKEEYRKERDKAMEQEKENYRPEIYKLKHNL